MKNNNAATCYLNEFFVLGKGIYEYDSLTIGDEDLASIDQIGEKKYDERLDLIVDPGTAQTRATTILTKYAPSHINGCTILVLANLSDALAQSLIEAEVSTRFTAVEYLTGVNKDFFIDHIGYKQDHTLLWVTIEASEA